MSFTITSVRPSKDEMIGLMNADLEEEFHHMMFYLMASTQVRGLHRLELEEFLYDEAKDEMNHIREFSQRILGLGGTPVPLTNPQISFSEWHDARKVLQRIVEMEKKVVDTFATRIKQTEELGGADGLSLHVFYEDMIGDSRATVDKVTLLLS